MSKKDDLRKSILNADDPRSKLFLQQKLGVTDNDSNETNQSDEESLNNTLTTENIEIETPTPSVTTEEIMPETETIERMPETPADTKTEQIPTSIPESQKTKQVEDHEIGLVRKTYYQTPEVVEAIRILDFEYRNGISNVVEDLLRKAIPEEILQRAIENIKKQKHKKRKIK